MGSGNIPIVDPITAQLGIGGGGKGPQEPQSSRALSQIAQQLISESTPLRRELLGQSLDFTRGDFDVTGTPQFGALKQATEQQFDLARQRTLGQTAEGGALTQALSDIEQARAGALTAGIGGLASEQQNQAIQLATGGAAQGIQGLGSAGAIQAQIAQAQAQQTAGAKQGLGYLAATAAKGGA